MKKNFFILILPIIVGACAFEDFDKRSAREAKEFTEKQCPRKIDKFTTLDSMIYDIPSKTLEYYYTLSGDLDNDTIFTIGIWNDFKNILLEDVANSVELKRYKEHDVHFCYRYFSEKNGKLKYEATFSPEDYRKSPSETQE